MPTPHPRKQHPGRISPVGVLPSGGLRVLAYLRVSTDEQATTGYSIEAQRGAARDYCALHGYDLVDVIEDDRSAKDLDRPRLREALDRVAGREVDALLVVKLDRLTRSVRDLGTLIDGWFGPEKPGRLLAVWDAVDTETPGGRLTLNVLASVAQWEREAISARTRDVLDDKRTRGERVGGIPYGLRMDPEDPTGRKMIPEPTEIPTLNRIRELAASGLGGRAIASRLNRDGLLARTGFWHPTMIVRILDRVPTGEDG